MILLTSYDTLGVAQCVKILQYPLVKQFYRFDLIDVQAAITRSYYHSPKLCSTCYNLPLCMLATLLQFGNCVRMPSGEPFTADVTDTTGPASLFNGAV